MAPGVQPRSWGFEVAFRWAKPPPGETIRMKSRIHPTHKTQYRVKNWAKYEQGLIQRGDITIWLTPEAISAWSPKRGGKPGGQRKFTAVSYTHLTLPTKA